MTQADRTWTPEDQGWLRENLREAIDHLVELGYTVRGGQGEDPELINPGGSAVQTWREDYPYEERMSREEYELEKYRLQIELLKFQYWGQDHGLQARDRLRGPGRGRQGRNDQALHRAPESPLGPGRGVGQALRP